LKAVYWYNADLNIEFSKIDIRSFFRQQGFMHKLMRRPAIARQTAAAKSNNNLIGTQATPEIIDHQDAKVRDYIRDNSDLMFFEPQLEDLIDYKRENRKKHDLTVAMGLAEMADEEKLGVLAKPLSKPDDGYKMFGYYRDPVTGYKKYGEIPNKAKDEIEETRRSELIANTPVRWIDESGNTYFETVEPLNKKENDR
jgi:hypothetical protein